MMKLNDWMCITDGRVTEGSEFGFQCYGDRAYTLTYWNGQHGEDEVSTYVVYDRRTFDVYEAEAYDGAREVTYIWRPEPYRSAYDSEFNARNPTWENEWPEIVLENYDDFIAKATAIINGEPYDDKIAVPLDLDKDELFELMVQAHERNITLNQLVEEILIAQMAEQQKKEEAVGSTWPFKHDSDTIRKMKSRVTWLKGETPDFVGIWNVIKTLDVIDCSTGQFTGGVVSCTYETPVYTYEVLWYNGDTESVPDEIIREDK